MQILKPALSALRSRDPRQLGRFEDLLPIDAQLEGMMMLSSDDLSKRYSLLSSISPAPTLKAQGVPKASSPKLATASSKGSAKLSEIAKSESPLQQLREEGWLCEQTFEFSDAYRARYD